MNSAVLARKIIWLEMYCISLRRAVCAGKSCPHPSLSAARALMTPNSVEPLINGRQQLNPFTVLHNISSMSQISSDIEQGHYRGVCYLSL